MARRRPPCPECGTAMTQAAEGNRLQSLQVLRFLAAFMVLFGHVQHEALSFGIADDGSLASLNVVTWGSGVDIFFVISGFIMYFISAKAFGTEGAQKRFLKKRIIRLVPLYWLFTSAMLLAMAVFPGQIAHTVFAPFHIAASYFFVPWLDSTGLAHPILGLGWTLNYEVYFYLLFSFALLFSRNLGLIGLVVLFVILAALNPFLDASWIQLRFWTDPIIIEFLCGIGIAALLLAGIRIPVWGCWALFIAGIVGIVGLPYLALPATYARLLSAGIPAALLVAAFAFAPFKAATPAGNGLVLGGDASYALYLSHPFSINLVVLAWQKLGLGSPWLFMATATLAAIIGSIVVHLLIEKPLTARLNAMFGASTADRMPRPTASPGGALDPSNNISPRPQVSATIIPGAKVQDYRLVSTSIHRGTNRAPTLLLNC